MELTFLGTSSGSPTADRNVAALAVRWNGIWDLFDCGEGTQHQLTATPLALPRLRRIYISHLHGDHCFGLFGVLGSRSMDLTAGALTIFGPPGVREMVEVVLARSATYLDYPLDIHEVSLDGERVIDDDGATVDAIPLVHRLDSFAWSIRERDRDGEFDVDAAARVGVPRGPLFGDLQRGESVTLDDGRRVDPEAVIGPPRRGRHLVVAGDNSDPERLFAQTTGADMAVHEATYTEATLAKIGDDHGHSTAARVASAAERHGIQRLALTHFSARYASVPGTSAAESIADVEAEARAHFAGELHLARDLDRLEVPLPD
ncbi:MAG: ribonuclease Z [Actinomycetota bacterium]